MPRILNKIKNPQEETILFNENFDRISLDIADRSGVFSTTGEISGQVISNGATAAFQLTIEDSLGLFEINNCPVIIRADVYINNDVTGAYLYPLGGSLTAAQVHGFDVELFQFKTVVDQVENEKATAWLKFKNATGSSVTIYAYVDVFYIPAPDRGIVSRAT